MPGATPDVAYLLPRRLRRALLEYITQEDVCFLDGFLRQYDIQRGLEELENPRTLWLIIRRSAAEIYACGGVDTIKPLNNP